MMTKEVMGAPLDGISGTIVVPAIGSSKSEAVLLWEAIKKRDADILQMKEEVASLNKNVDDIIDILKGILEALRDSRKG